MSDEKLERAAAELYNFRLAQEIAEQAKGKTIDSGPINCKIKLTSIATTAEVVPDINDRVSALEAWKDETAEALNLDLAVGYGLVEDWLASKNRLRALEERVAQLEPRPPGPWSAWDYVAFVLLWYIIVSPLVMTVGLLALYVCSALGYLSR